ncbi:MAG TPA: hypothetical protein PKA64_22985, partial [Myxococcota bacterium]|nr:hypothetical protein [Myxococcota bacterium]
EDERIVEAFREGGIDWTDGPDPASPDLDVRLLSSELLYAGAEAQVVVQVTNRGAEPVHRLVAVAAGHDLLDGAELPFGFIAPGDSRTYALPVRVEDGYPSERAEVALSLRGSEGHELQRAALMLETVGRPLPELAWRWRLEEPVDGEVAVGDVVRLRVEVENVGEGATRAATARIKSGSGKAADILVGTLEPGVLRDDAGAPCAAAQAGCSPSLRPGERWEGVFEIKVLESLAAGYRVTLSLADDEAFDYGAIVRGGFASYSRQQETITFSLGGLGDWSARRSPPRVDVSLVPGLETTNDVVTVSGRVTDDQGIADVLMYAGDDKVFVQGEDRLAPSVPFSADIHLQPGRNTISVLARDAEGFSWATSRVVWRTEPELHASIAR